MRNFILVIFTLVSALFSGIGLSGCATTGTVVVRTNPPDANVYLFDTKTGSSSILGKSPLTFSKDLAAANGAEVFQIRVEKEGFETKYSSIAAFGKDTTYVDLKLSSPLSSNDEVRKAFEVNRQLMQEATRLAAGKRFSEALLRVEKVIETDPKNDEALAAKGSVLYLMKDYEGAQTAWKKSLEVNPSNESVRGSLVDLNINMDSKSRSPASTEGQ